MTKLCLRERAENGEDGMAKFVLEDPATHLTSVSCDDDDGCYSHFNDDGADVKDDYSFCQS